MKSKTMCSLITFALITTSVSPVLAAAQSVFPSGTGVVAIANNFMGTQDTITFDGRYFLSGDVVKVYSDSSKTTEIGLPATINFYKDDAIISVDQLGQTLGSVYVTLKHATDDAESDTVAVPYGPEVTVINNVDKADTVTIKGLKVNDIAKVYAKDGSTLLGQATAVTTGDVTVTLTNPLNESDLAVQVTVTSKGIESSKTVVNYLPSPKTNAPIGAIVANGNTADIVVTNNANNADTVTFLGLKAKDVAKVYASDKTTVLGQSTAVKDGDLIVTLANQLSESTKQIYVTLKSDGQLESDPTSVQYFREVITPVPDFDKIVVTNNALIADIINVSGLTATDVVKVYDAATAGNVLGTATVGASKTDATVSVAQLGTSTGTVYVTVTNSGKLESDRIAKTYDAEAATIAPGAGVITVTNNITGKSDTVNVTGLKTGDIVKVYKDGTVTTPVGTATVLAGKTYVTISITQLGTGAGSVYVSVTSVGKAESTRTPQTYTSQVK